MKDLYVLEQPLCSFGAGTAHLLDMATAIAAKQTGRRIHAGLDIAVAEGTPVHCALAGQVVQAGFNRIRGSYIMVRHANGVQTLYQHLSCGFVRAGESVGAGAGDSQWVPRHVHRRTPAFRACL